MTEFERITASHAILGAFLGSLPCLEVHGTTPFTGSSATSARRRTATPAHIRRSETAQHGGWG